MESYSKRAGEDGQVSPDRPRHGGVSPNPRKLRGWTTFRFTMVGTARQRRWYTAAGISFLFGPSVFRPNHGKFGRETRTKCASRNFLGFGLTSPFSATPTWSEVLGNPPTSKGTSPSTSAQGRPGSFSAAAHGSPSPPGSASRAASGQARAPGVGPAVPPAPPRAAPQPPRRTPRPARHQCEWR